ncbi:AAA family ATPase [Nodosilinea sp. LEGE 06152]|uniref:AAA family ATPase n=1 Tax=Nodosilinea sp. LEGE 06152 TaxID=2777966 RepID=UPI00187E70A0|nr:AAA family ATPase [Nodosilinea sp. LEGE 06152]MBE9157055.1 AAA family ATPase [Nodosilinea sp. LEGE 06152]
MQCLLILVKVAIAHLMYGFIGSGKTTYATQLEKDLPALRFSIDEWMIALYGQDSPESEFEERYIRTADLIWNIATRVLELDQDVILDFGFWSRKSRDDARERLSRAGAGFTLYYVTCADEVMEARALSRTAAMPKHALYIDKEAIDSLRGRFELLGYDESCKVVCTD